MLSVGTSSAEATVTANGLYCDAVYKTIDTPYADVNVVNGTLTLNSGQVNGLMAEDYSLFGGYRGYIVNETNNHFTLQHRTSIFITQDITSTVEYFVNAYMYAKESLGSEKDKYLDDITRSVNLDEVEKMVNYAVLYCDNDLKTDFIELLTDAKNYRPSVEDKLNEYISELQGGTV